MTKSEIEANLAEFTPFVNKEGKRVIFYLGERKGKRYELLAKIGEKEGHVMAYGTLHDLDMWLGGVFHAIDKGFKEVKI